MCSEDKFLDEQCLDEKILGENKFFFLRKCRLDQACQILTKSPTNNSIGICVTRRHHLYDGDNCRKNYECSSGICKNNQCEGLPLNRSCDPNRYQCKLGLICITQSTNNNKFYSCQKPIEEGKECKETNDCNLGYICSISSQNSNKTCIKMGSLEIGQKNSDAKACKTGDSYNNICIRRNKSTFCNEDNKCNVTIESNNVLSNIIEDECKISSKGASLCPDSLIEQSFENYTIDFFKHNDSVGSNFNIEKYKYTLDVKSVIEKYFLYQYWYLVIDSDECAYEYFFLLNNQKRVIFNFKIIFFFILIIL
jgi:hypothetical protein